MRPHSERLKQLALDLHEQGLGPRAISRRLGVSRSTIARWTHPEYHEKQRQSARDYKARHRGSCARCGQSTWIGSIHCKACANELQRQSKYWTKERVLAAIRRWADEHDGKPPSALDWVRSGDYHPPMSAVYGGKSTPYASWADAIEAAGFPRPRPGYKKNDKNWDHDAAQRLREQGISDREISKRLGISASTIVHHLGLRGRNHRPVAASRQRTRAQRIEDLQKAVHHQDA